MKENRAVLNCVICDDNAEIVTRVNSILSNQLRGSAAGSIRKYTDARNLYEDILEEKPIDLAILDIEMPYHSGKVLAREISKRFSTARVIFLTSYVRYAVEAYELDIFRFVPKERMDEKLPQYIREAIQMIQLQDDQCYVVDKASGAERIPYREIVYVTKDGKNTVFHCLNGREVRFRQTLAIIADTIDPKEFIAIDRGCYVNLAHIARIQKDMAILMDGSMLPISRQRYKQTKDTLCKYWSELL